MVKLPDYTALGTRLPQAVSSSPNFPSSDASASAMGRFGQTLQQVGEYWGKKTDIDNDAIDLPKAESLLDASNIKTNNFFETDSDFATQPQRAEAMFRQNLYGAAANIRNPRTRQIFIESRSGTQARQQDGIIDYSRGLQKQQSRVEMNDTMKRFYDIYVDPKSTPAQQAKALADMNHTLEIGLKARTFDPAEGDQMKATFIDKAPWEKGRLAARNDSRAYDVGPVTIADIPNEGAAFLNTIAGVESGAGGYNVINGGDKFSDFSQHPNRRGRGGTTTAAGKYQMVYATWMRAAKALGLKDFSPESQDRAAWWNAQFVYNQKTGRDLTSDLKSKDANVLAGVRRALAKTEWTGLQSMGDGEFVKQISGGATTFDHGVEAGGDPLAGAPDYIQNLPPDQRQDLIDLIKSEQAKDNVDLRSGIEVATQNAPAAIQNTGAYDGHMPTLTEFQQAYGGQEGGQRFDSFQASLDVAGKVHGFQQASNEEIAQTIEAATPRSSGTDAALETKKYEALSTAGAATLKARADDPAGYTMQAFPNVQQGFHDALNAPDDLGKMQAALAGMKSAQDKLGIPALDQVLIPKKMMADAVDQFKDETLDPGSRLGGVLGMMQATNDPAQQKQIFDQAVKAGLPDITAGAFAAMERGEPGAAQRLFQAALTDISKLPGKSPETQDAINEAIQSNLLDAGQIGDIVYGITGGEAGDTQEAERDAKLLSNAINLRVRKGEDLEAATIAAGKDLFGDVKAVTDYGIKIVVPAQADGQTYIDALETLRPKVEAAVKAGHLMPVEGAEFEELRASGMLEVARGQIEANTARIMSDGYFYSSNGGYVFIDAGSGQPVMQNGQPLFFSEEEVGKIAGQQQQGAAEEEKAQRTATLPEDQSALGVLGQRVTDAIFGPLPGRETP